MARSLQVGALVPVNYATMLCVGILSSVSEAVSQPFIPSLRAIPAHMCAMRRDRALPMLITQSVASPLLLRSPTTCSNTAAGMGTGPLWASAVPAKRPAT